MTAPARLARVQALAAAVAEARAPLAIFYVYEHWRPDLDVCFYVGKGKGNRATQFQYGRNRHYKNVAAKLVGIGMCVEVRMVANGLTESEAFTVEIERIAFWREIGVKIVNLTNGGEGPSGYKQSDEHRRKRGDAKRAFLKTPEGRAQTARSVAAAIAANTGKKLKPETKLKMSKVRKGHPLTKEQLAFIERAKKKTPEHIAAITKAKAVARELRLALEAPGVAAARVEARRRRRAELALERYHRLRKQATMAVGASA